MDNDILLAAQLDRVEAKLDRVEAKLDRCLHLLGERPSPPTPSPSAVARHQADREYRDAWLKLGADEYRAAIVAALDGRQLTVRETAAALNALRPRRWWACESDVRYRLAKLVALGVLVRDAEAWPGAGVRYRYSVPPALAGEIADLQRRLDD